MENHVQMNQPKITQTALSTLSTSNIHSCPLSKQSGLRKISSASKLWKMKEESLNYICQVVMTGSAWTMSERLLLQPLDSEDKNEFIIF